MEQKIIKSLLQKESYNKYKQAIVRDYFSEDIARLYDIIVEFHDKSPNHLDIEDIAEIFIQRNTFSRARAAIIRDLITSIKEVPIPDEVVLEELLSLLKRKHIAREIATAVIPIMNSGKGDFIKVKSLLEDVGNEQRNTIAEATQDFSTMLSERLSTRDVPIPISSLQDRIQGIGKGSNVGVFGRPEAGKTSLVAWFAARWIEKGCKTLYLAAEEPANQVLLRIASAFFSATEAELRNLSQSKIDRWERVRKNLYLYDAAGASLSDLDDLCAHRLPSVAIIDQTDKLVASSVGDFQKKDYERLGFLWQEIRNIAKRRRCATINVSQASFDAEGARYLNFSTMARSRTDKGGELDLAIGIGRNPSNDSVDDGIRYLSISKNKISGWKGAVTVLFDPMRCTFTV